LTLYILVKSNRVVGVYEDFGEAVKAIAESGGGEIYKAELIAKLTEEEAQSLRDLMVSLPIEPVEAPISKKRRTDKVLVVDRDIDEGIAKEIASKHPDLLVYKLVEPGRGKVASNNMIYESVESNIDTSRILEDLARRSTTVYFITGDKKVYTHASAIRGIRAYYVNPTRYSSRSELVNAILEHIT